MLYMQFTACFSSHAKARAKFWMACLFSREISSSLNALVMQTLGWKSSGFLALSMSGVNVMYWVFKIYHWLGYSAASYTNPVTTLAMPAKFPNDIHGWISDMGTDGPPLSQKGANFYYFWSNFVSEIWLSFNFWGNFMTWRFWKRCWLFQTRIPSLSLFSALLYFHHFVQILFERYIFYKYHYI